MDVREGLQRILTSCSFVTKDCLQMCVTNLLDSLKKYPQVRLTFDWFVNIENCSSLYFNLLLGQKIDLELLSQNGFASFVVNVATCSGIASYSPVL